MILANFNTKWKIIGWPKTMVESISRVKESNSILKVSYADEMDTEQENFKDSLGRLSEVYGFIFSISLCRK